MWEENVSSGLKVHQTAAKNTSADIKALFCVRQVGHQSRRLKRFKLSGANVSIQSVIRCLRAMKLDMMSAEHYSLISISGTWSSLVVKQP